MESTAILLSSDHYKNKNTQIIKCIDLVNVCYLSIEYLFID